VHVQATLEQESALKVKAIVLRNLYTYGGEVGSILTNLMLIFKICKEDNTIDSNLNGDRIDGQSSIGSVNKTLHIQEAPLTTMTLFCSSNIS
jgi:hypothetical protein